MNSKRPLLIAALACLSCLGIECTLSAQFPLAFVPTESRYYDSLEIVRQLEPFVRDDGHNGWTSIVPASPAPNGLLYLVQHQEKETVSVTYEHFVLADERYCSLRRLLVDKSPAAPPQYQLPKCFVVVLQDALAGTAKIDDINDLRLILAELTNRVQRLEEKK